MTSALVQAASFMNSPYLEGQFLVAMPGMPDKRFARSVIYVCAHSKDGAMGIVVNDPATHISFADLLNQLDVIDTEVAPLPQSVSEIQVFRGGPMETGRGFVLHSEDYFLEKSTLPIEDGICLTATLEILKAVAHGRGPEKLLMALGYSSWGPGQLEGELQSNGWLNCPAESSIIFEGDLDTKYDRAMAILGVDPAMLSSEIGRA